MHDLHDMGGLDAAGGVHFIEDAGFGQGVNAIQQVFVEQADEVGVITVKRPDLTDSCQLMVWHGIKIKNIVDKVN